MSSNPHNALSVAAHTVTTALGPGNDALWQAIAASRSGLRAQHVDQADLHCWTGRVDACDEIALPTALAQWDCRNNRLAELGLQQDGFMAAVQTAVATYGADRLGLYLGTSTSGIGATEQAYREVRDGQFPDWFSYEHSHDFFSVAGYVAARLGIRGPRMVISTACSSSAKVFASAARAIDAGFCDAAVVGGVDSLCLTTLHGFHALQLVSPDPCRPCDVRRAGLSIGEAAGFALVTPKNARQAGPLVLGWGESGDAHHMTSPHPEGHGAELAMARALHHAGLRPADIGYINLHGTGTQINDLAENRAISRVFGNATPVASSKGWTGHTLGAAGIVEAVICWQSLLHRWLPENLNTQCRDPLIKTNLLLSGREQAVPAMLSNSFGFGGSNCSLVLGLQA